MNNQAHNDTMVSLEPTTIESINKLELKEYFKNSWELNIILFSSINKPETFFESPDPLRNPLIFYWGHSAAFYINKMIDAGLLKSGINEHFEKIFARGVDPDLPENLEAIELWPSVNEVNNYRNIVYQLILDCINDMPDGISIYQDSPYWSLLMGIEHDRIHFETSSVLIRQLDISKVEKPKSWNYAPSHFQKIKKEKITIEAGNVTFGKNLNDQLFGWDNEYGTYRGKVNSFQVSNSMVSNEEYLTFVESGNYNNPTFWTEEGIEWKTRNNVEQPRFWEKRNNTFVYRAMFDEIEMPLSWPAEVNAHEAIAYCNWLNDGARLLHENEYQYLLKKEHQNFNGIIPQSSSNINMLFGSPSPIGMLSNIDTAIHDLTGNVWEWLSNSFRPLDGFETHSLYEDFSHPYFDDEHNMLLGGSWATTGTGASYYYRLWFRRNFYQHAGFRLAWDA